MTSSESTWLSVFNEKLFEIPKSKICDFGFESFGWNEDITDLEISVKDRVTQIVKVGHAFGNPWKKQDLFETGSKIVAMLF